jgi:hypothetical protein
MDRSLTWKVLRASVVGTSHASTGLPCQDSCFADLFATKDGQEYMVCVVSDGAGSAVQGGDGAELTCTTAVASIAAALANSACLDVPLVEDWIKDIRRAIYETADLQGRVARDYACTLLGSVIGPKIGVFFQVGDGGIVATSGEIQGVVFWPDNGIYANMTYFVTDEDAITHLQVAIAAVPFDEIAVFSDGIQRLALSYSEQMPYSPFFEPMLQAMRKRSPLECEVLDEQLRQFLGSPAINQRTDDDKTLVLATRRTA